MADDISGLLNQLRVKNEQEARIQSLRGQEQTWNAAAANAMRQSPTLTSGGDQVSVAGRNFTMPRQENINWGAILQGGLSNYMSAKKGKEAQDLEAKKAELNSGFFMSAVGDDPQAQKLAILAQSGVPGADRALAQHIAPKKEAMGAFLQALPTLSPDAAAELAPRYGLTPELGRKSAEYAAAQKQGEEERGWERQKALKMLGIQAADARASRNDFKDPFLKKYGMPMAEFLALPKEEQANIQEAISGKPARETQISKEGAKQAAEATEGLPHTEEAITRVMNMVSMADKATYLPLGMGLAPAAAGNQTNQMLEQGINQLVLDAAGGKLGAGISNADVEFLKSAQANLRRGNRDTAVAQLNAALASLLTKRTEFNRRLGREDAPIDISNLPTSKYDYDTIKRYRTPSPIAPAAPAATPPGRKSFDELWKEAGGQ